MAKDSVTRSGDRSPRDTSYREARVKAERLRQPGVNWARPGYYTADPNTPRGYTPANMAGVGVKKMPAPTGEEMVDIRGYLGDERTGIRKTVPGAARKAPPAAPKVVTNVVRERTSPAPARTTQPARMAVNRATGKTTGFTSGTTTGKTMTKAGVASKTAESAYQRQQRMAAEKSGGSMRSTGGGSSRSTGGSTGGRGGTGPSGMGYSGRGTGGKR